MADGFDAGSIAVRLQATLTDFQSGIESAKSSLDSLGTSGRDFSQKLDTSRASVLRAAQSMSLMGENTKRAGRDAADAFDNIDRSTTRTGERFLRITAAMVASQIAIDSFGGKGKKAISDVGIAAEAGAQSLTRFITIVGFMPTPLGIALGTIAAIVTAMKEMAGAVESIEEAATNLNARLAKSRAAVVSGVAKGNSANAALPGVEQIVAPGLQNAQATLEKASKATQDLAEAQDQLSGNAARLTKFIDEQKKALENLQQIQRATSAAGGTGIIPGILETETAIKKAQQELDLLNRKVFDAQNFVKSLGTSTDDAAIRFRKLQEAFDLTKAVDSARKLEAAIADVSAAESRAVKLGVTEYATALQKTEGAIRSALEGYLRAQADLLHAANLLVDVDDEAVAKLRNEAAQLEEIIGKLTGQLKATDSDLQSELRRVDLAKSFSSAFGDGLRDAILNAKKPMEALAAVGTNLFANMVDQTIKRLETGMTEAFKSITGIGGEGIGLAITGILGAAGAVLSKLGSKGSDSFGSVQSAVTSSQAVRGIVAGPSSVAIADVGDNLSRAIAPVVGRLDTVIGYLASIDRKTGSGGRGGPGTSNVALATP